MGDIDNLNLENSKDKIFTKYIKKSGLNKRITNKTKNVPDEWKVKFMYFKRDELIENGKCITSPGNEYYKILFIY